MSTKFNQGESGQALLELSLAAMTLVVFVCGIIDFGRAVYDAEVMRNLTGQVSDLASRGTSPATAAQTVATYATSDLDIANKGCVIVSVVTNNGGTPQLTNQASQCAIGMISKIGCIQGQPGCSNPTLTIPASATTALQSQPSGSSVYITEIYYSYSTTTPITALLQGSLLPAQLYSVAYF